MGSSELQDCEQIWKEQVAEIRMGELFLQIGELAVYRFGRNLTYSGFKYSSLR
jgi:hypothetical protein